MFENNHEPEHIIIEVDLRYKNSKEQAEVFIEYIKKDSQKTNFDVLKEEIASVATTEELTKIWDSLAQRLAILPYITNAIEKWQKLMPSLSFAEWLNELPKKEETK